MALLFVSISLCPSNKESSNAKAAQGEEYYVCFSNAPYPGLSAHEDIPLPQLAQVPRKEK